MTLTINGEVRTVDRVSTVAELASALGAGRSGVAVAVNDEVIAQRAWSTTALHDGDRVEVLGAMQGG